MATEVVTGAQLPWHQHMTVIFAMEENSCEAKHRSPSHLPLTNENVEELVKGFRNDRIRKAARRGLY